MLVSWRRTTIMIDCGIDWAASVHRLDPDAILITHAHPDHAGGLKNGARCPVYATPETWDRVRTGPVSERMVVHARKPFEVGDIIFQAFPVEHSIRAPAVGYRLTAGRACAFYAPDLVRIYDERQALAGVQLYIGDGASITRPIVRRRGDRLIGHASIRDQVQWCRDQRVPKAIFTHCGSQIVAGDERLATERIAAWGSESGVEARLAHDGLELQVRS